MIVHYNNYNGLKLGPFLREAGVGGSNPLTPTNMIFSLKLNLIDAKITAIPGHFSH